MDPFMFAVLLVVLAFVAVVLRTMFRWKGAWRWAASLPLVVLGVAVLNIALYPASHNLLPFELIMWVVLGFFVLGIVAAVRSRVLKEPKTESVRGRWG
jgi:peptidoglycan/LPS O-acetylase OafA/YrhL